MGERLLSLSLLSSMTDPEAQPIESSRAEIWRELAHRPFANRDGGMNMFQDNLNRSCLTPPGSQWLR